MTKMNIFIARFKPQSPLLRRTLFKDNENYFVAKSLRDALVRTLAQIRLSLDETLIISEDEIRLEYKLPPNVLKIVFTLEIVNYDKL